MASLVFVNFTTTARIHFTKTYVEELVLAKLSCITSNTAHLDTATFSRTKKKHNARMRTFKKK